MLDRRNFLKMAMIAGSGLALGTLGVGCSSSNSESSSSASGSSTAEVEEISSSSSSSASTTAASSTSLVVFFSRAGENYDVGVVEEGNTAKVAKVIAEDTGADLFQIEPVVAYPEGYEDTKVISTRERDNDERPEIQPYDLDWDAYDTIYLGYPIWYGGMPMIMYTFIESMDWSGKTVYPFDTHGGSGLANTVSELRQMCVGATVENGLALLGTVAQNDPEEVQEEVRKWLEDNADPKVIRESN